MNDFRDRPQFNPARPSPPPQPMTDAERRELAFGPWRPGPPPQPMTRGQQTAWIVGTMLALFLFVLGYFAFFQEDPRYPGCPAFFGEATNSECAANIAARILMRGGY